ncbi:MAG: efflux RND transporter periplasmic adaptor subunit [Spirochaetales bacterium]|nr:efflux RND transporter periplasmic adaptor subunit [Spirochaetales bacterium]
MKKRVLIPLIGGILLILLILFSLRKGKEEKNTFPEVNWVMTETKALEETISASGVFRSPSRVIVNALQSGWIDEISVEEGDMVQKGQILLALNREDFEQQVLQDEAALERIRRSVRETLLTYRLEYRSQEISLGQSREKLAKQKELFALEAITEEELNLTGDTVERDEDNLRALGEKLNLLCGLPSQSPPLLTDARDDGIIDRSPDVKQQILKLEQSRRALERCSVRADLNGKVVKIAPDKGALVNVGTELFILQGDDPLEAVVTVDEVDIGKLKVGDAALLRTDSLIGEKINGHITAISPILELFGNTRAGQIIITLENGDLPLRSGASCIAELTTLASAQALTLPVAAIATERGRITAFRLEESEGKTRLAEVELETGISTIDDLEILGGASAGDRFALPEGELILRDGLYVTPREEVKETEESAGD